MDQGGDRRMSGICRLREPRVDFPHCEWRAYPEERLVFGPRRRLKDFFCCRRKTKYRNLREGGKRASTIRVSIGNAGETLTRTARAIAKEYSAQISRGRHPKGVEQSKSTSAGRNTGSNVPRATITLRQAATHAADAENANVTRFRRDGRSRRGRAASRDRGIVQPAARPG